MTVGRALESYRQTIAIPWPYSGHTMSLWPVSLRSEFRFSKFLLNPQQNSDDFSCSRLNFKEIYNEKNISQSNSEFLHLFANCTVQVNIWKFISWNCGERYENKIDHCNYVHNLSGFEIKAWKKFRLARDSNPWPLPYWCSAQQTGPSSHVRAGHFVTFFRV